MSTPVKFTVTLDVENAEQLDTEHTRAMLRDAISRQYDRIGLTRAESAALVVAFSVVPAVL